MYINVLYIYIYRMKIGCRSAYLNQIITLKLESCKTSKAGVWRVIYIHVSFVFLTFWTWLRCWKGAKRETDQIEYNSFLHSQKTCFFRWYMYVACIEILRFYSSMYEYNKCWGCGWQYCMIIIPFTDTVSLLSLALQI